MRSVVSAFCTLLPFALLAQGPQWADPPKLVVGIVVDQMRVDDIYRYWDNFGDGGLKRLVRYGSFQRDVHYNYVPTQTAPGHASIYTGTTPSRHGIVANWPYNRATRHSVYIALDTMEAPVGTESSSAMRSPQNLLASTLADELELRTAGRSRTVGVALKDRAAIMPIGRMGDAAYWFAGDDGGKFVTSSWYGKQLPKWLDAFNAKQLAAKYLGGKWELALPRERFHTPLPDLNPYEEDWHEGLPATLPLDLSDLSKGGKDLWTLMYTPWGNTITTDMAIAAIDGDSLGMDAVPDLLSVSYSSLDEIQHALGQRSLEGEDACIRLDRELARLLDHLDKSVGQGAYTVFLTADHGGGDVPAWLRDQKASAGYTSMVQLRAWLEEHGFQGAIDAIRNDQVYLTPGTLPATADSVARVLNGHPGIAFAISADELLKAPARTGLAQAMANGFLLKRSGDVLFALHPGYFRGEPGKSGKGADHGTGWNYDAQVPVIFFGKGVAQGEVLRRTSITDVAPTVSAILGMSLPNAADGQVVPEVVKAPFRIRIGGSPLR